MLFTIGILVFVAGILFSIFWHELGHFIPAKRFGVKVPQFMVGFGPTMWSRTRGETEYGIKWLPFGGYVRMIGMFPPRADGTVRASSTGRIGLLIEEARQQSQADVLSEEDEKRTFYRLPVHRKLIVMLGGPVMNLILATILFAVVLVGFGTSALTPTVSAVTPCVPTASNPTGECGSDGTPSPAAAAGLQPGDTVTAINGLPISSWSELLDEVKSLPAGPATITITRGGVTQQVTANIVVASRPVYDADGNATGQYSEQGFLGMAPSVVMQRQSFAAVPAQMWDLSVRTGQAMLSIPSKFVGVVKAAFSSEKRDPNGPVGIVGVTRIGGEVAADHSEPASWRIASMLSMLASLNLFLFLFNLLPILPLDGGHVVGALWEGIRRQWAKLRNRPDPGPVDVARALPLAYGVAVVLISMSALLLYADIVKPISLKG